MGFFDFLFGKKDKAAAKAAPKPAPAHADGDQGGPTGRSRRAIKAGGGAKPAPSPAPPPAARGTASVRQAPGPPPASGGDGGLILSSPPSSRLSPPPPAFAGGLDAARGASAHSRTGDAAMLDFLGKSTPQRPAMLGAEQIAQVRVAADQDGIAADMAAVKLGLLTEEQLVNALTQECWVPHLKVDKYEIRKKALDTIARQDAEYYGVFPVDKLGSLLTLAMANPLDAATIDALAAKTGLDIKKVVATRSEIAQGIDKYYGGKIAAKDASHSFTQDIEPKSVTQMMAKVASASERIPAIDQPAPRKPETVRIQAEIQDIDDLLAGDETIAPAIIEPISLKAEIAAEPEAENDPVIQPPTAVAAAAPAPAEPLAPRAPAPAAKPQAYEQIELDDTAPIDMPRSRPAPEAAEFQDVDAHPASATGALERAAPTPAKPAPIPPQPARPAAAASSAPAAPQRPVSGSVPRPAAGTTTTSTLQPMPATGRVAAERTPARDASDVVPVTEAEFQHAITHGRSHIFEKWISLQTRNRVINAVPVEREVEPLLEPLFAHAVRAG